MASTLTEYLNSQQELEQEAALALPHSFSQCTYPLGHIRQAVYLCITCASRRGICSSCSIACHTDHEQLELFPKRHFRCDCSTSALAHPCSLHTPVQPPNEDNKYGQNFDGIFCRCGRPYDANVEQETMIQCLACEDWYHESCLNLRARPPSRLPTPEPPMQGEGHAESSADDALSDASSSGLPRPLITADDYDALVCRSCVSKIPILQGWAGTPGIAMVVRDDPSSPWRVIGTLEDEVEVEVVSEAQKGALPGATGSEQPLPSVVAPPEDERTPPPDSDTSLGKKRVLASGEADEPDAKRSRVSPSSSQNPHVCLAPAHNSIAQRILTQDDARMLGTGDVFLTGDSWRKRWCLCESCSPNLRDYPYLLEEEDTYQPPEDPDSKLSLEELGLRALERIPRDRALDGIRAFNSMRDDLKNFLRPFAQDGREVAEDDVRRFFEARSEAARTGQKQ
ncbi:hypothetical protein BC834DRAFT_823692 [Gloeopeniophorella convolvens]|nr:hypothetical protein BC834DRAFT_823692 [Gloeopeniophorella convolvens]